MFETHYPLFLAQAAPAAGGGEAPMAVPAVTSEAQTPADVQSIEGANGSSIESVPTARPQSSMNSFFFMLLILVLFMFVLIVPQRREKKRRNAMLEALKKGDRVQTVGGIIGTIVELRPSEVVVKVDENTNTRMRFSRSAVQSVIGDDVSAG